MDVIMKKNDLINLLSEFDIKLLARSRKILIDKIKLNVLLITATVNNVSDVIELKIIDDAKIVSIISVNHLTFNSISFLKDVKLSKQLYDDNKIVSHIVGIEKPLMVYGDIIYFSSNNPIIKIYYNLNDNSYILKDIKKDNIKYFNSIMELLTVLI